jgi:hypothetical protein
VALLANRNSSRLPGEVQAPVSGVHTRTAVASSRREALVSPPAMTIREPEAGAQTGLNRVMGISPLVANAPVVGSKSSVTAHGVWLGERRRWASWSPGQVSAGRTRIPFRLS